MVLLRKEVNNNIIETSLQQRRSIVERTVENLSLIAVLQYVAFRFLQSTMFPLIYSDLYKTITIFSLAIIGGSRFLWLLTDKYRISTDTNERKKTVVLFFIVVFFSVPFIYVGWRQDYKILVFMPLAAISLYGIKPEKVIKWFVITIGTLLIATIICSMSGCIRVISDITHAKMKIAYGICNMTDFAAYILFILLFTWCIQKKESIKADIIIGIISILVAATTYFLTQSKTTVICCVFLSIACIWNLLAETVFTRKEHLNKFLNKTDIITAFIPVIMIIILLIMIICYGKGEPWAQYLDDIFSRRIHYQWEAYQNYGINLFGTYFDMTGNGGTMIIEAKGYNFIDSSYAFLFIRYGIIVSLIFFGLWIMIAVKAIKSGRRNIAYAMAIMAIYALSESHIQEINYNILTAMPLCAFTVLPDKKQNDIEQKKLNKANWFSIITAIVIAAGAIVLLPKAMSWFRTIVFLNHWNSGTSTIWPLLVCIGFILLLIVIWKAIIACRNKMDWKPVIAIACVLSLIGFGVWRADSVIREGQQDQKHIIAEEEELIRLMQSAAEQPIYAAERSELYKRQIGGFSDYAMTLEDFCRLHKGTIIVDKSNESTNTLQMGGWYLQFSDNSGVYSYDPAVRTAMTEKGFEWKKIYYSERSCDLEDLAQLNGLDMTEQGSLILNGKDHSLRNNRLIDQYTGDYEVRYDLSIDSDKSNMGNDIVCRIQITGRKGETIILEREITVSEFDNDGHFSITIPYTLTDTPRMEYRIEVEDGVKLLVNEIAWKRVL